MVEEEDCIITITEPEKKEVGAAAAVVAAVVAAGAAVPAAAAAPAAAAPAEAAAAKEKETESKPEGDGQEGSMQHKGKKKSIPLVFSCIENKIIAGILNEQIIKEVQKEGGFNKDNIKNFNINNYDYYKIFCPCITFTVTDKKPNDKKIDIDIKLAYKILGLEFLQLAIYFKSLLTDKITLVDNIDVLTLLENIQLLPTNNKDVKTALEKLDIDNTIKNIKDTEKTTESAIETLQKTKTDIQEIPKGEQAIKTVINNWKNFNLLLTASYTHLEASKEESVTTTADEAYATVINTTSIKTSSDQLNVQIKDKFILLFNALTTGKLEEAKPAAQNFGKRSKKRTSKKKLRRINRKTARSSGRIKGSSKKKSKKSKKRTVKSKGSLKKKTAKKTAGRTSGSSDAAGADSSENKSLWRWF